MGTGFAAHQIKQHYTIMNKYTKRTQELVENTLHRMQTGRLYTANGQKVKDREQAIAIALSEAREKGFEDLPSMKKSTTNRPAEIREAISPRTKAVKTSIFRNHTPLHNYDSSLLLDDQW